MRKTLRSWVLLTGSHMRTILYSKALLLLRIPHILTLVLAHSAPMILQTAPGWLYTILGIRTHRQMGGIKQVHSRSTPRLGATMPLHRKITMEAKLICSTTGPMEEPIFDSTFPTTQVWIILSCTCLLPSRRFFI